MSSLTSNNARQYGDSRKLAARARLNSQYTIAENGVLEVEKQSGLFVSRKMG